ncbi:hypothetical protein DOTSEDRAFT_24580 [Dothistroma septosporum NZE10]|uniref:Prolyl 4-hydroxylase alpha subunit Fe(2+) 2OG dioxygenase domain-containing protein n=1 Tax=Dothistroma septosporum (strain NZE10 / CBS 128990) TaxID=675120 RepID=N1PQ57_DOTSN|nr:hypothetical protein DOTSEDRAFT_24580 [Dothistroma septosporum NZE10]
MIDVVTQLFLPPITGEVQTTKPVPVQDIRKQQGEEQQERRRIKELVQRLAVREHGMFGPMDHAETIPECMHQSGVPIVAGEALDLHLQNMLIVSAMPNAVDTLFPAYVPAKRVREIAIERIHAKIHAEQERLEAARREHNMHKRLRQRGIRAELYKLNVYSGPCGMFKSHIDTPHSDNQIGSLVVAVPVAFADAPRILWAAFNSDCEHEVLKVTSRHRLTLTYDLFVSAGTGLLNGAALSMSSSRLPLYRQLSDMLKRQFFFPDGCHLGVYLTHSYPHTNNKVRHFVSIMLEGLDMATYEAYSALDFPCVLTSSPPDSIVEALRTLDMLIRATPTHRLQDWTGSGPLTSLLRGIDVEPHYGEDECCESGDVGTGDDFGGDNQDTIESGEQCDKYGEFLGVKDLGIRKGEQALRKILWLNKATHKELGKIYMVYGNQAEMKVSYSSVALLAKTSAWQERHLAAGSAAVEDE